MSKDKTFHDYKIPPEDKEAFAERAALSSDDQALYKAVLYDNRLEIKQYQINTY